MLLLDALAVDGRRVVLDLGRLGFDLAAQFGRLAAQGEPALHRHPPACGEAENGSVWLTATPPAANASGPQTMTAQSPMARVTAASRKVRFIGTSPFGQTGA
jgi:hypothetical protein